MPRAVADETAVECRSRIPSIVSGIATTNVAMIVRILRAVPNRKMKAPKIPDTKKDQQQYSLLLALKKSTAEQQRRVQAEIATECHESLRRLFNEDGSSKPTEVIAGSYVSDIRHSGYRPISTKGIVFSS